MSTKRDDGGPAFPVVDEFGGQKQTIPPQDDLCKCGHECR